ncbi:MAG: NAD(P)H-dependent flavin oxidoreductase [Promethearchaeota archaeon]
MIQTKITEMLDIKYPIIGGTMMNVSTPELVSAFSNAGGCGVIASAMYKSPEELREALQKTKTLTDKPFAVNINLFPALMPQDKLGDYVKTVLDEGVKIIETSGHKAPEELIPLFKDGGAIWDHKCAGVRYAKKAASLGADIVTVVGYENGGATGRLDIGSLVMTPSVVDVLDALDIPVIAGGGVSDGRGIAALLALGAEGVIIGTRIMCTKECAIHNNLKQAFVEAKETDTALVMRSIGNTHRAWKNAATQKIMDLESEKATLEEIVQAASGNNARRMIEGGVLEVGMISCGQGVGLIHDIPTVKELLDRMMEETEQTIQKLTKL